MFSSPHECMHPQDPKLSHKAIRGRQTLIPYLPDGEIRNLWRWSFCTLHKQFHAGFLPEDAKRDSFCTSWFYLQLSESLVTGSVVAMSEEDIRNSRPGLSAFPVYHCVHTNDTRKIIVMFFFIYPLCMCQRQNLWNK